MKTVQHVEVMSTFYSIKTLILANRYFSELKSYRLQLTSAEVLESFKTLRKTKILRISFQKRMSRMGQATEQKSEINKICEEGEYLRRIGMKTLVLDVPNTIPSEMMEIAKLIPRSANVYFELVGLRKEGKINEEQAKLAEKVQGIKLKHLWNESIESMSQSVDFLKNLTHLHLGKDYAPGGRDDDLFLLDRETNLSLFSKLRDLQRLKSLKVNMRLTGYYARRNEAFEFLDVLNFPAGLEVLSLGFENIDPTGRQAFMGRDFAKVFEQIGNLKELRALRLSFYIHPFCQRFWKDFVSLFPRGLPKLEILSTEVRRFDKTYNIYPDRVFEWVHSHPMLRNVRLDIPLLSCFEMDNKKMLDFKIKSLENLSVNIAREKMEQREAFDDLIKFWTEHEGLKCLALRITRYFNLAETFEILNKYLSALENLEDLKLEFEIHYEMDLEQLACLKPLMKKFRSFSLGMEIRNVMSSNPYYRALKKVFADEIKNKKKGLEITLNRQSILSFNFIF